jgi:hypothetical protein
MEASNGGTLSYLLTQGCIGTDFIGSFPIAFQCVFGVILIIAVLLLVCRLPLWISRS